MTKLKILIVVLGVVLLSLVGYTVSLSLGVPPKGNEITIDLKREKLTVIEYPSRQSTTRAIVLFGSGDGGWNSLEAEVAGALQVDGFDVIGIDSEAYATSDYDLDTLQSDFAALAQMAEKPFGEQPRPLIVGGYSMGAAQAIAVAGGPHPPPHLIGLLLMDPLSRGRYGLRTADQMNVLPTGSGTFSVADFAANLKNLRVVQWHAAKDPIDSRAWLTSLAIPYREFDFPGAGHGYDVGREAFLTQFVDSADWIVGPSHKDMVTAGKPGPTNE
jgi:pimeloyl-ACP methyl ester carboxylesterase